MTKLKYLIKVYDEKNKEILFIAVNEKIKKDIFKILGKK